MNTKLDKILAEISAGELVDKITILEIKKIKISDKEKLKEVDKELISLNSEELTIQVPNKFHFEWLESKYRHLIDDAIQKYSEDNSKNNGGILINPNTMSSIHTLNDMSSSLKLKIQNFMKV